MSATAIHFCLALAAAAVGAPARARPRASAFVPVGAVTEAPRGFAEMCGAQPLLCQRMTPSATTPAATTAQRETKALLDRINRRVNDHVRQQSDARTYGAGELWRASGTGRDAAGDCEDLAIEKRLELLAAGFPADRLFFAVVYHPQAGLHTVLVARTDDGDLVLDSRRNYLTSWSSAGYDWVSVQSTTDPARWHGVA